MKQGELIWKSIIKQLVSVTLITVTVSSDPGWRPVNSEVEASIEAYYQTAEGTKFKWAEEGLREKEWMIFWSDNLLEAANQIRLGDGRIFELKRVSPMPSVLPQYYKAFGVRKE